jgi:putative aminopeptidase FrvX
MPNHHDTLKTLTSTPTASGKEHRIIAWITAWAASHPELTLSQDAAGNLSISRPAHHSASPIIIEAHMDHPAFVCTQVHSPTHITAEFRGGVHERFFPNTPVRHWPTTANAKHSTSPSTNTSTSAVGHVHSLSNSTPKDNFGANDSEKHYHIHFPEPGPSAINPGDIITWDLPPALDDQGILRAPACDDLAGLAAAICAFDELLTLAKSGTYIPDIRLLFTRAEEVGFVGAIAACKLGTIPKGARIIALENSKSFPESPLGAGPIVRVGDYTSTFDPDLTYKVGRIAQALASEDPAYKSQRKLMPGGTCEASAFLSYGYTATCVCLALGNYHNMNDATGRIEPEFISLCDFDNLVRLLVQVALRLDNPASSPSLKDRLDKLHETRQRYLAP